MTSPVLPITQAIVDQATSVLDDAATGLQAVAAALPALLASGNTGIDATSLVAAVTNVVNAANAVSALLPPAAAPVPVSVPAS
jgi:hypothetical protein